MSELKDRIARAGGETTPVTPAIEDELARMTVASQASAKYRAPRHGMGRWAAAVTAGVLVLGGASAAAAVTFSDWSPWAQDPDVAFTYELPSGATCELRLGQLTGEPEVLDAAREYLASIDVMATIDIDSEIQRMRSDPDMEFVNDDGTRVDASYGSKYYKSPDVEYADAVHSALNKAIEAHVAAEGIDTGDGIGNSGEGYCTGTE